MSQQVSPNTQAILLLTAPLSTGRASQQPDLLTPGEFKQLAITLRDNQLQLSDLLSPELDLASINAPQIIDSGRLKRLLGRGFQLSQAIERWQTRAIWVISRSDPEYPSRISLKLKGSAPPILYGCGDTAILENGGLAVVGSRNADEATTGYSQEVGRLTARAQQTLISGGARGIDESAMRGALEAGGTAIGVLADSLERAALNRENRRFLMDGELALISPYDPAAGFNVGHAMQRNKLIYALSDAALVVRSDYNKGGTWAGATEQLDKLQFATIYVCCGADNGAGLDALQRKGALRWPEPQTPDALRSLIAGSIVLSAPPGQQSELDFAVRETADSEYQVCEPTVTMTDVSGPTATELTSGLSGELFAKVRDLLLTLKTPKTLGEIAADLEVSDSQAKKWLARLVDEGVMDRLTNPTRYGPKAQSSLLE